MRSYLSDFFAHLRRSWILHQKRFSSMRLAGREFSIPERNLCTIDCDVVATGVVEASACAMTEIDDNRRRRLVEFKDGCRYGRFGKTKAYELIARERIRAYKMGGKTLIDLDSIDEYHASLPRVESRAML